MNSGPMKNYFNLIFITVSLLFISAGCAFNKTLSPDLLVDNQQIVSPLESEKSWSDCDTLVITCIDYRFAAENQNFINETLRWKNNYDHVSIPGSIYNLVNLETRELFLNKFSQSVKLHLINRVVIINHIDCGGYGGSASFGAEIAEYETHIADLRKARNLLIERYPTLEVNLFLESLVQEEGKTKVRFEKIQ